LATDKNTNAQCFKVINNEKLAKIVAREYDDHFARKHGKIFIQFCENHWQTHQIKFDRIRYIRGAWQFIFNNSIAKIIPITIDCKDKTFNADGDKKKWRSFNSKDGKKGDSEEVCRSFNL
tara:strand:- start:83 stop:442 length:360 start_codon:yes stop_codon:yes gene_type:complete